MATGANVVGMSIGRALNGRWSAPQPSVELARAVTNFPVASRLLWTCIDRVRTSGSRQFQAGGIECSTEGAQE